MSGGHDIETGEITALYRRSATLGALFAALAKAQGEFEGAKKEGKNPHFNSRYATLESVVDATRDGLASNELCLVQMPGNQGNHVAVTSLLGHSSGEWIESTVSVAPARFDAQSLGSVITYLRRYARLAICGIAPEDDDGTAATGADQRAAKPLRTILVPEGQPFVQGAWSRPAAATGADQQRQPIREPGTMPYDPELGAVPVSRPADSLPETEAALRTRRTKAEVEAFLALAQAEAAKGLASFRAWWDGLARNNKALLQPRMEELKRTAAKADTLRPGEPEEHPVNPPLADAPAGDEHAALSTEFMERFPVIRAALANNGTTREPTGDDYLPGDPPRGPSSPTAIGDVQLTPDGYPIAPLGDGAEGGEAADGEAPPRDPFWSQQRLYQAPAMRGDRPDNDVTRAILLQRIAEAADSAELMRFAADSKRTIDGDRLAFKSTEIQTAIAARLAELPA